MVCHSWCHIKLWDSLWGSASQNLGNLKSTFLWVGDEWSCWAAFSSTEHLWVSWEVPYSANSVLLPVHGSIMFMAVFSMVFWRKQAYFHSAGYWHWVKAKNYPVISNSDAASLVDCYRPCSLVTITFLRQTIPPSLLLYSPTERALGASLIPEFSYLHWADAIADFTTRLCLAVSIKISALNLG